MCSYERPDSLGSNYGVHLRTKIIENKIKFEVQKLDYPCRNLVIWSFELEVTLNKLKLDIADVEVQITIPTEMQITWFKLQFTFSTLISHLIVNNATIIFHKIPNETFNLNLKSRHIFEFEKRNFNSKGSGSKNTQEPEMIRVSLHCTYGKQSPIKQSLTKVPKIASLPFCTKSFGIKVSWNIYLFLFPYI